MATAATTDTPTIGREQLARYTRLADSAPRRIRDAMRVLLRMVKTLQRDSERSRLELLHSVPWEHELREMQGLFESIDRRNQRELRAACFHLLFYGWEMHDARPQGHAEEAR